MMKTTDTVANFLRNKICMQTVYIDQDICDVLINVRALERKVA